MRKLCMLVALSLAILSGCFGRNDEPPVVIPEDPQMAFDELSQKQRTALSKSILGLLPEMEYYQMAQTDLSVNISAIVPEMGGDMNANITAKTQSNATDPENPESSTQITLNGNATGDLFSGKATAALDIIIADASMFARLQEINVDIPNVPVSQIMDPLKPIIGKWYGDTFNTINESIGGEIGLQDIMAQGTKGPAEIRMELGKIIENANIFKMKERLEDENGFSRFSVVLDNERLKQIALDVLALSNPSTESLDSFRQDLNKDLEGFSLEGIMGFDLNNEKYFTFTGNARQIAEESSNEAEIIVSYGESEKIFTFKEVAKNDEPAGHTTLTITHKEDGDSFTVVGGGSAEEQKTLVTGKISESKFEATLYETNNQDGSISISLEKNDNTWSGQVTNTQNPDMIIRIDSLRSDPKSFSLSATILQGEETLGSGSVEYRIQEVSSVDITAPEEYDPFGMLMENFLPLMMMGTPGVEPGMVPPPSSLPPAPEEMTEEEIQMMIKEMMEGEGVEIDMGSVEAEDDSGVPMPPAFPTEIVE